MINYAVAEKVAGDEPAVDEHAEGAKESLTNIKPHIVSNNAAAASTFKVIFNKQKYDVVFDLDATVAQLKDHLHTVIGKAG